jgi:hypothetical protein
LRLHVDDRGLTLPRTILYKRATYTLFI